MSVIRLAIRPLGVPRLVLCLASAAYGVATIAIVTGATGPTTYGGSSAAAALLDSAAGGAMIAAGIWAMLARPSGGVGPVATLLGVTWFAPDWVGFQDGSALVRSAAAVAAPFLIPLLVHLVVLVPADRLEPRAARLGVTAAYAVTTVAGLRALVRDPFLDRYCWNDCDARNVFLVHADERLARTIDAAALSLVVAMALAAAIVAAVRLAGTSRAGRTLIGPVLAPAALAAVAQAVLAAELLFDHAEDPRYGRFLATFAVRAVAVVFLALGVGWLAVRGRRAQRVLAQLAADLGASPQPGALRAALARSLGDDGVAVVYWLPASGRYVDIEGRRVDVARDGGRTATPIVRDGSPVALVLHDGFVGDARDFERAIGPAARLAIENERLRAEVRAQVDDLRASRARIVEAGDAARRRLERDLHDGAQQRLLALSYDLRVARALARAEGDADSEQRLAAACAEAQDALGELRDVAHGIHPAVLTEAGLGPALETLLDTAAVPVVLSGIPDERFPRAVETAAYVVAAEAIERAAARGASEVVVRVVRTGPGVVVEIADDAPGASGSFRAADRVGALGGLLTVLPDGLRAELPCA